MDAGADFEELDFTAPPSLDVVPDEPEPVRASLDYAVAAGDLDVAGIEGPSAAEMAADRDRRDTEALERAKTNGAASRPEFTSYSHGVTPPSDADPLPPGEQPTSVEAIERAGALAAVQERLGLRALASIPNGPAPPLKLDRLDPEGHTILFGPGGVGKGTLAAGWVVGLQVAGDVVLIVDYEDHGSEWSRRCDGLGGELEGIYYVSPSSASWRGRQGAIWQQADDLRAIAEAVGATYLVVDSIVVACGAADPLEPAAAGRYTAALARIGRPTLSLGHVTKAEDARYPFGSVFWHNLGRVTWSLARGQGGAILTNRKANNHPPQGRYLITATWYAGRLGEVGERAYSARLAELIAEALMDGPATVRDIVTRLDEDRDEDEPGIKPDSVSKALRRGLRVNPRIFTVEGTGDRAIWGLAA